jgi:electron transport complex protein RnfG
MPPDFDNNIYDDVKVINYSDQSGNQLTTTVYRARRSDQPIGVVFMPIPAKGYNGTIHLSIGIHYDGTLSGVQVLKHWETEGLGGNVHQDKTDWLNNFAKQSFDISPMESWAIKDEAGVFDQLSGATITSRGVINAVKNSLKLYTTERDTLFSN